MTIKQIGMKQVANQGDTIIVRVLLMGEDMDVKEAARRAVGGERLGAMIMKVLSTLVPDPNKTAFKIVGIEYNSELVGVKS